MGRGREWGAPPMFLLIKGCTPSKRYGRLQKILPVYSTSASIFPKTAAYLDLPCPMQMEFRADDVAQVCYTTPAGGSALISIMTRPGDNSARSSAITLGRPLPVMFWKNGISMQSYPRDLPETDYHRGLCTTTLDVK